MPTRLKLSMTGHSPATVTLDGAAPTVLDVAAAAGRAFGLPATSRVGLCVVYPRHEQVAAVSLDAPPHSADAAATAASVGISSGSAVDVRVLLEARPPPSGAASGSAAAAPSATAAAPPAAAPAPPPAADERWPCAACTFLNTPAHAACDMCGGARPARMERHVVPADNACLFTALAYLTGGGMAGGPVMRRRVAAHIEGHPETYTEGMLGQPPAEYARHMQRAEAWGGGIELRAASDLLGLEVVALSVKTGGVSRFGEERAHARRVLLLYDGIHYDAVHRLPGPTLVFDAADGAALEGARAVAAAARAARQYTDLAGFSLACLACGAGLTGEKGAREHAAATGHTNFAECPA